MNYEEERIVSASPRRDDLIERCHSGPRPWPTTSARTS